MNVERVLSDPPTKSELGEEKGPFAHPGSSGSRSRSRSLERKSDSLQRAKHVVGRRAGNLAAAFDEELGHDDGRSNDKYGAIPKIKRKRLSKKEEAEFNEFVLEYEKNQQEARLSKDPRIDPTQAGPTPAELAKTWTEGELDELVQEVSQWRDRQAEAEAEEQDRRENNVLDVPVQETAEAPVNTQDIMEEECPEEDSYEVMLWSDHSIGLYSSSDIDRLAQHLSREFLRANKDGNKKTTQQKLNVTRTKS
jgi:hypothetical protein